jgi:tRNA A37 threonylcarbamoyladenosine biosynthesis protein TsaE
MDAYRLGGPAEALELDVDALLAAGPLVVEWADRIRAALPDPAAIVAFSDLGGEKREIVVRSVHPDS